MQRVSLHFKSYTAALEALYAGDEAFHALLKDEVSRRALLILRRLADNRRKLIAEELTSRDMWRMSAMLLEVVADGERDDELILAFIAGDAEWRVESEVTVGS